MAVDEVPISAAGKRVVIIGGGDTGADCLGTAHRQGAASVHQFEIMPRPPDERPDRNPWPTFPMVYKVTSAHEEGGERVYSVNTECFVGEGSGRVTTLHAGEVERTSDNVRVAFTPVPATAFEIEVDLVLLAMGFLGPTRDGLLSQLGVTLNDRGNVSGDASWMTSVDGVFTAGDMQRVQSLVVWAIAEGRSAAAGIAQYLRSEEHTSELQSP